MAVITGSVESIIFRNEQNGYTVLELACADELNVVCGNFSAVREGEKLSVTGEWRQHKDYGLQFIARTYQSLRPETLEEIETYLASGIIRGIGPSTARAIVDTFGNEALDIMEMAPQRLMEVPKIGRKKAEEIADSYAQVAGARTSTMFLQALGLSTAMAAKIYGKYGDLTVERVSANPYLLIDDIEGIGFRIADSIAEKVGINRDDVFRISGGIRFTLNEAAQDGHMFLPKEELISRASAVLRVSAQDVLSALETDQACKRVVLCEVSGCTAVYLPPFFYSERQTAMRMAALIKSDSPLEFSGRDIDSFENENHIRFAPEQRAAVETCMNSGVIVITGGPGTGKTTIINCIITLMRRKGMRICLAAPTGRAAKRMTDATGQEAKTLHRLLEYAPRDGGGFTFAKNQENQLDVDVCIVDEASMIDIFLMNALLAALRPGVRLIIVGDADQLPSVGAGNVLRDIIDSGCIPVSRLTEIFRQGEGSMIVYNAHCINNGDYPEVNGEGTDFFFESHSTEAETADAVLALVSRRLPEHYGLDVMRDIQVLCPQKRGECGVNRLNERLQNAINPQDGTKRECRHGELLLREGDKVMQIRNDYDITWRRLSPLGIVEDGEGIFNGDMGIIAAVDSDITVRFDDGREAEYDQAMLDDITLAYAISVHKSQGCEFNVVVIPLFSGPPMLYVRNLLYTAVTRARRVAVLTGRKETMHYMINNNIISKRYSNLACLLKESTEANGNA